MIMTMFATSIKFVKLVNMIILRFLRFLRFLGFLAKYIVKWLKCQKFNNSIILAIELLRSLQIKPSRIHEDKLSRRSQVDMFINSWPKKGHFVTLN